MGLGPWGIVPPKGLNFEGKLKRVKKQAVRCLAFGKRDGRKQVRCRLTFGRILCEKMGIVPPEIWKHFKLAKVSKQLLNSISKEPIVPHSRTKPTSFTQFDIFRV